MDGALFWILILVFYFLYQGLASRRSEHGADTSEAQPPETGETVQGQPTAQRPQQRERNRELDTALGEIRDLLSGEEQRAPERRSSRTRTPAPRTRKRAETSRSSRQKESNRLSKRSSPTSTFDVPSTAEEKSDQQAKMEEMAEKMRDGSSIKDKLDIEHIEIPSHEEMRKKDRSGISDDMRERLRDAASAREAVLIAEVIGPPRSRHSNLRRLVLLKR